VKKLLLFWLFSALVSAKMNPYVTKGESITDIGSDHSRYIEVPLERISYTPQMLIVENELIYTQRELARASCDIDALNHEACSIDKTECAAETEYAQGSAVRGEGYISCTQLHVDSYYDPDRDKCVLPSGVAEVCKDFAGTAYDSSRDLCIKNVTRMLPADLPEKHYGTLWSSGNHDPKGYGINDNLIFLKADFWGYPGSPSPYHCGGKMSRPSPITINGRTCNALASGLEEVPCTEVVNEWGVKPDGGWGMINGCYCVTDDGMGDTSYENPDSNGMCQQYVVHSAKKDFCDGWRSDGNWQDYKCPGVTYSCNADESLSVANGQKYCTKEVTYSPACSGGFFSSRDKSECLGDRLKYDYYSYSCPSDENVYGNEWDIVDAGGDCGEYSLTTDTNGDGIKDRCNSSAPSTENCERTTFKCSFNPNAVCILDEKKMEYNDFTKWTVLNYAGRESADCPSYSGMSWWVVDGINTNSVFQKCNGYPTYFLSNYELEDGHITMQGTFKTDDPGDNDWFGFVFGFKDSENYYLLDWSRWKNDNWNSNHDYSGRPLGGAIPLTLSKATNLATYSPLWSHADSGSEFNVLQRKDNGGWSTGVEYNIKLDITKHDIKVWIGKVGEPMNLDIDYHSNVPMDITGKLGFYNFSISRVTYKDFLIEWVDGKSVDYTKKRPLIDPAQWSGAYKEGEYGALREGECSSNPEECTYALSRIEGRGNKLCFENKAGTKGCFEANGVCRFDGIIDKTGVQESPLFSFLNSPDEVVSNYHSFIGIDYDSPTNISLDFSNLPNSNYQLGQMKTEANEGDQITVDFWMFWRGGKGMPIGFSLYDLWITDYSGQFALGFNTGHSDLYGIKGIDFLKNSWHKITAVFTQGDFTRNELYIDGVKQVLGEQHPGYTFHDSTRSDITNALQLSGWSSNSIYSLDAKMAGLNVYEGGLEPEQIKRLYRGGVGGISRLAIGKHSIYGYDADDLLLGEINSTCELSGKVGFLSKTVTTETSSIGASYDDGSQVFFSNRADVLKIGEWEGVDMIRVDTSKRYIMSGTMSIGGSASGSFGLTTSINPPQYAGFVSYDIDKKIIYPYHIMKVSSAADTILSADLHPGDTSFIVDNASGWYDASDHYYSRSFVWYGYRDSRGHTYADYTYTRNFSGYDAWEPGSISQNSDGKWTIHLRSPWAGPFISKGSAIRNSSSGGTYNYVLLAGNRLANGEYHFSAHLGGAAIEDGGNAYDIFRPGTAYIAPLFIFNYRTSTPADVRWSNILLSSESGEDLLYVDKKISNPIVAAKVIDNRIEFWNSYEKKGSSGHIELMKYVAPKDEQEGFKHEFEELTKLYDLGFTGFKSYTNGMTYATSLNPMSIDECQEHLRDTHYFLAERNISDPIGLDAIETFSSRIGGTFGNYCIIQSQGDSDNLNAEYAVKHIHKDKVYTAYFCSPWSCVDHMCGYAACPSGSFGDKIKEVDRRRLTTTSCIDQKCDINSEYFRYCGNPFGCDSNDYTITQTDDGKCKKAECNGDDLFDPETGTCEKIDCKYLKMDGKCYKKTY